ncbi:GGDEF domain-containing protein [Gorillibacterium sp. sgz5001074]|uniref:GGDEF domain-containing protein n=1 Tax=Gorillibacterium sp. sgz5001074 TaxID=3446695 RepID=UPI003F668253
MGRWIGSGVMLAASSGWIGLCPSLWTHMERTSLYLMLNGILGFGLGYWFDRVLLTSLKDDLTQAYNRRFVTRTMPSLLAKATRRQASISITLIDCDDFKKINDQCGHAVGDLVLQGVSRLLITNIRRDDYVVRWGGDEFLVIADYADHSVTQVMMDRLEHELALLSKEMNFPLSVSVGTAVFPSDASKLEDLIRIADHRMYEKKHDAKGSPAAVS